MAGATMLLVRTALLRTPAGMVMTASPGSASSDSTSRSILIAAPVSAASSPTRSCGVIVALPATARDGVIQLDEAGRAKLMAEVGSAPDSKVGDRYAYALYDATLGQGDTLIALKPVVLIDDALLLGHALPAFTAFK